MIIKCWFQTTTEYSINKVLGQHSSSNNVRFRKRLPLVKSFAVSSYLTLRADFLSRAARVSCEGNLNSAKDLSMPGPASNHVLINSNIGVTRGCTGCTCTPRPDKRGGGNL